jgi:hypothetical protein
MFCFFSLAGANRSKPLREAELRLRKEREKRKKRKRDREKVGEADYRMFRTVSHATVRQNH